MEILRGITVTDYIWKNKQVIIQCSPFFFFFFQSVFFKHVNWTNKDTLFPQTLFCCQIIMDQMQSFEGKAAVIYAQISSIPIFLDLSGKNIYTIFFFRKETSAKPNKKHTYTNISEEKACIDYRKSLLYLYCFLFFIFLVLVNMTEGPLQDLPAYHRTKRLDKILNSIWKNS